MRVADAMRLGLGPLQGGQRGIPASDRLRGAPMPIRPFCKGRPARVPNACGDIRRAHACNPLRLHRWKRSQRERRAGNKLWRASSKPSMGGSARATPSGTGPYAIQARLHRLNRLSWRAGSSSSGSRPSGEQAQREQAQREQAQQEQAQREQARREQAQREQALSGSRPSGSRLSGSKPSGNRPSGSRPAGNRPSESNPAAILRKICRFRIGITTESTDAEAAALIRQKRRLVRRQRQCVPRWRRRFVPWQRMVLVHRRGDPDRSHRRRSVLLDNVAGGGCPRAANGRRSADRHPNADANPNPMLPGGSSAHAHTNAVSVRRPHAHVGAGGNRDRNAPRCNANARVAACPALRRLARVGARLEQPAGGRRAGPEQPRFRGGLERPGRDCR